MNEHEFQLEAVKRAPLLDALRGQPKRMSELDETLSMSRSTIHRALGAFQDANVVRKTDKRYALTGFGRTVAERTHEFSMDLSTARDLDEFLTAVDAVALDIPMQHFADAEVIRPEPRKAHRGVKRIVDLIQTTDSLRMFSNVLSPLYADVARQAMIDGMELEVIFDERIMELLLSEYAEDAVEAFQTGRFEVYFGSDVPFELFIADDTMAMAAHNESTVPRMFVESCADGAIEWAEGLYQSYREGADRFHPGDLPPVSNADVLQPVDD